MSLRTGNIVRSGDLVVDALRHREALAVPRGKPRRPCKQRQRGGVVAAYSALAFKQEIVRGMLRRSVGKIVYEAVVAEPLFKRLRLVEVVGKSGGYLVRKRLYLRSYTGIPDRFPVRLRVHILRPERGRPVRS